MTKILARLTNCFVMADLTYPTKNQIMDILNMLPKQFIGQITLVTTILHRSEKPNKLQSQFLSLHCDLPKYKHWKLLNNGQNIIILCVLVWILPTLYWVQQEKMWGHILTQKPVFLNGREACKLMICCFKTTEKQSGLT